METTKTQVVTVETTVNAPVEKAWEFWTNPVHVVKWNNASHDWHSPRAENDLRPGGKFSYRMEARDGSMGFDFGGTYDVVKNHEYIESTLGDGRKVKVAFIKEGSKTKIIESFETEPTHSIEMQRTGWQAIIDNMKKYTEEG